MPVTITIHGETAGEAIKELSGMTALMGNTTSAAPAAATETPDKPMRQAASTKSESKATKAEESKQETAAQPAEPENEPVQESEPEAAASDEPIPDVVQLRAVAAEKGKTPKGKKAVKALLDQFGCSNISAVPDDKRAAFLRELEAL